MALYPALPLLRCGGKNLTKLVDHGRAPPFILFQMPPRSSQSSASSFPAPPVRRVRGFAFDPSLSVRLETARANEVVFTLPWEQRLEPGPVGEYVEVIDHDPASGCGYEPVDLNDPHLLAQDGLAPSAANPKFHQQMVYAVAMTTLKNFERALGRPAMWASRNPSDVPELAAKLRKKQRLSESDEARLWVQRLRIYPHALREPNAYYSPAKQALLFGYFPASAGGDVYPFGTVFTCLSHDIVAHETTHALLDGMHPRFIEASQADGLAFHEAFADIVALFQHFTFPEVLRQQIARTRGNLETENLLGALAQEFGKATGRRGALRDAIGGVENGVWKRRQPDPTALDRITEPHERGAILVAAVFDAFLTIYNSRIADLKRIATGGSGVMPAGDLHPDLVNRLASEAAKTARQMLNMCIRALDYCPPVDINFGDYLRALITADLDLVPDDPKRYRLAVIDAFRARGIYPRGLRALSEESLQWDRMPENTAAEPALGLVMKKAVGFFSNFRWFGSRFETWKSTRLVRRMIHNVLESEVEYSAEFEERTGLAMSRGSALPGMRLGKNGRPRFDVHALWPIQRVRPDGTTLNQVVGSIIQTCDLRSDGGRTFPFRGGCTMIIDLDTMQLRYCVRKPINRREGEARLERHRAFRAAQAGLGLRGTYFGAYEEAFGSEPFALLHAAHD
jgi:hypothetical protein